MGENNTLTALKGCGVKLKLRSLYLWGYIGFSRKIYIKSQKKKKKDLHYHRVKNEPIISVCLPVFDTMTRADYNVSLGSAMVILMHLQILSCMNRIPIRQKNMHLCVVHAVLEEDNGVYVETNTIKP